MLTKYPLPLSAVNVEVLIEDVAGINSGYPNELYKENGAKIVSRNECLKADICLCVQMPNEADLNKLNENTAILTANPG